MASKRTSQERGQGSEDRDIQVPSKRRQGNPEQAETRHRSFLYVFISNVC